MPTTARAVPPTGCSTTCSTGHGMPPCCPGSRGWRETGASVGGGRGARRGQPLVRRGLHPGARCGARVLGGGAARDARGAIRPGGRVPVLRVDVGGVDRGRDVGPRRGSCEPDRSRRRSGRRERATPGRRDRDVPRLPLLELARTRSCRRRAGGPSTRRRAGSSSTSPPARVAPSPRTRRRCSGRPVDDPLVQASTRDAFALYARYWFDTFNVLHWSDERVMDAFRFEGAEHVEKGLADGKGVIIALPHTGNWDVGGRAMGLRVARVVSVAEHLKPDRLFELFVEHRRQLGMDIIDLASGPRGQAAHPAAGENRIVALVADRDLSGGGVEVEMFGRTQADARRTGAARALGGSAADLGTDVHDAGRVGGGADRRSTIEPTGRTEGRRHRAHARDRRRVRARDRRRAVGLASVPARLGTVRIVLVCPYAWDASGGVQVHVREPGDASARARARGDGARADARRAVRSRGCGRWAGRCGSPTGHGRPDRPAGLPADPGRAGCAASGRRPRPRAADAERVDVRDARGAGARRGDVPRLSGPVGR